MNDEFNSFSSDRRSIVSCGSVKQAIMDSDVVKLKTYVDNLKSNLQHNKKIVQSLVYSKNSESFEDTATSLTSFKAIESFMQENNALSEKVEKAMHERNDFQVKILLNDQIKNEREASLKELEFEYNEEIAELILQNKRKDKIIGEMTQINSVLKLEAELANKSKYVFEAKPSLEIIDQYSQVEEVRCIIEDKVRDMVVLESQKKILNKFIEETQKKILTIKALLANPINRKNSEKREKTDFSVQRAEVQIDELSLSRIQNKDQSFSGDNTLSLELNNYKNDFFKKSQKLLKISDDNLELNNVNRMMLKKKEELEYKASKLYNEYYNEEMTMEINQEYENSVCYKINAGSLNSIVEIEVNHSNFYESELSGEEY